MIERDAPIVNPLGMHVRPGAEFVKVANKFNAAECGSSIRIRTDGEDAEQAMAALLALVAAGFHEMHLKSKEKEDA